MISLTIEHLQYMYIPQTHWKCTMDQVPETCDHKPTIVKFQKNILTNMREGRGLYLFGDYSQGKSGLCSILLKTAAANRAMGLWLEAKKLPDYFIERIRFDKDQTLIERALDVPIVVLDEFILFGDKRDWYMENLVRDLIAAKKSIIITSNIGPTRLKKDYPALFAVMTEAILPVQVEGHNFRGPQADENQRRMG